MDKFQKQDDFAFEEGEKIEISEGEEFEESVDEEIDVALTPKEKKKRDKQKKFNPIKTKIKA